MRIEEEMDGSQDEATNEEIDEVRSRRRQKAVNRPKASGLVLTLFAALVVVLIGGLASYYYYNFQRQGYLGERAIKEAWSDTVQASSKLSTKFGTMDNWEEIGEDNSSSFEESVGETNRVVRNAL